MLEFIANCLVGIVVVVIVTASLFFVWGTLRLLIYLHDRRINGRH